MTVEMLQGKKIVIGITGSIAAFKIPYLIRLLKKEGAEVKVMMTDAARDFITPLTLSTLSGNPVIIEPFDPATGEWNSHVELGLWADLFILAPLSANTMAKMAKGIADNFLLTAYLSAKCDVYFAPAMDRDMYLHASTQENLKVLQKTGNILIKPAVGELASGLCGEGRLEEPEKILEIIKNHFVRAAQFKGKKVLVTAGPTYEPVDPVRYIGNHSSGMMGYAIAREFAQRGADVLLISGPTDLQADHPGITRIGVMTAEEMYDQCLAHFNEQDIIVKTAAVADFSPAKTEEQKIKKDQGMPDIRLKPTKDILKELGSRKKKNQVLVGFSLETDDGVESAKKKLLDKNLDLIVLNTLQDPGAGFRHTTNKVRIIDREQHITNFELKEKSEVAADIVNMVKKLSD